MSDDSSKRVLVHVGFPKTATTTIQSLFMQCPEVAYFGKGRLGDEDEDDYSARLLQLVLCATDTAFNRESAGMRKAILVASRGRPIVISDEALTLGESMRRGHLWKQTVNCEHERVVKRLAALFPDANMLVGLRRQEKLLESFYRQHSKIGSLELSYQDWLVGQRHNWTRPIFDFLEFDVLLNLCCSTFGRDHVYAFDFAGLTNARVRRDLEEWVQGALGEPSISLANALISQQENIDYGRPPRLIRAFKKAVGFVPGSSWASSKVKGSIKSRLYGAHDISLTATDKEWLALRFRESNERLKKDYGIELQ